MTFLNSLVERGILQKKDVGEILHTLEVSDDEDIDSILSARNIDPGKVLSARSEFFNVPIRDVSDTTVAFDVLKNVPEESAVYYKFVPISMEDGSLAVGILDPDNLGARDAIQFIASKLGVPFKLYLISREGFERIIDQYKGLKGEVNKALSELETELGGDIDDVKMDEVAADSSDVTSTKIIEEAPVTKIVAVVLRHAIEGSASDIHIEHVGEKVRVRFRVDGVMYTSLILPASVHNAVVARIKILTKSMKLDEKRKPQDGRFSARIEGRKVDFRVSTFPAYYGEKVVMRILDTEKGVRDFESLGLTKENIAVIREAIKRPYGLILLTGPTGSGKTTTLYSMLNEIDRDGKNVISLEDPVEYNIPGMNQSQVRPEIGYTFANGLRSILRQDPDIIMVGEIRDKETAQLAIQAALTGHLVFSTIHTNNASGVIPRLVDMGVDPFLIAPTLILAIAQRLLRVVCKESRSPIPVEGSIKMMVEKQVSDLPKAHKDVFMSIKNMHGAVPSDTCPSGTRGRIAVYEILKVDQDIEQVILNTPIEEEVSKTMRKKGMISMKEDAFLKCAQGVVTFEEVNGL